MGALAKYADASAVEAALDKGAQAYERTEQMYTKSEVDAMIQELANRITAIETPTETEE
jgi:hypothetical protein